MSQHTDIQWCDSSVNPTSGCDGCELWEKVRKGPCYSGPIHEGRLARAFPDLYAADFSEVRMIPGRMAKAAAWSDLRGKPRAGKPWLDGLPRLIFVGDMADVFSAAVTLEYLRDEVVAAATSGAGRRHIWMLLTKRPKRAIELADGVGTAWPDNLWLGTSITSRASLSRARDLLEHWRGPRFLSVEPLWQEVDLAPILTGRCRVCRDLVLYRGDASCRCGSCETGAFGFDLVIVGGQSRQKGHEPRPFDVGWARKIVSDCRDAETPCFVKQLGSRPYDGDQCISIDGPDSHAVDLDLADSHGGDWDEWPADLRVREFPASRAALSVA